MTENSERIAELYFRSNSIRFGLSKLSAHIDNPDLPLSPYYLHYPKPNEAGSELLTEMFSLIGDEFYNLCESQTPAVKPKRIAGVPDGALSIAKAHARHYSDYPNNVLTFSKINSNGATSFAGPNGSFDLGDELVIDEDHTSGGRNKKLIRAAALSGGLTVSTMLTVVDRQQGGVENMARDGVRLLSILTIDTLLDFALQAGYTSATQVEEIREYKNQNQLII